MSPSGATSGVTSSDSLLPPVDIRLMTGSSRALHKLDCLCNGNHKIEEIIRKLLNADLECPYVEVQPCDGVLAYMAWLRGLAHPFVEPEVVLPLDWGLVQQDS